VSDKPKGTPEQVQEYRDVKAQALALVERMNAILIAAGRVDYTVQLKNVRTLFPTIEDDSDAEAVEMDPRYLPEVSSRRIGSERAEREDEGAPIPGDDDDGEDT